MNAVIGIDKPAGMTSFDVVSKLRRATNVKRIGHTGTLDPDATGVLVLCFGAATRLVSRLTEGGKSYEAVMFLGMATDTADSSGSPILEDHSFQVSASELASSLDAFRGEVMQVPPMYSALKVKGRKLCDIARGGGEIAREPRKVYISRLEAHLPAGPGLLSFGTLVGLDIDCSQGTYIRTLCEDIGRRLGVPAHMSSLRRTMASGYAIGECVSLDDAMKLASKGELQEIARPLAEAIPGLPRIILTDAERQRASCGNELLLDFSGEQEAMLMGPSGEPVAIARSRMVHGAEGKAVFSPEIVFNLTEGN